MAKVDFDSADIVVRRRREEITPARIATPQRQDEDAMANDCASCSNYTAKEYLDDYLARACGETYCGLCRMKADPGRGAFILRVLQQPNCRDWEAEELLLAA